MQHAIRKKVELAKVRMPQTIGQAVLVPGHMFLTAAHCLQWTPDGSMVLGEMPIQELQAGNQLFNATPWAVEPVSDIAALGALDSQTFPKEWKQFEAFCDATEPLEICTDDFELFEPFPCYVFTHKGTVVKSTAQQCNPTAHCLVVTASEQIEGGTSGGPVTTEDGRLLGVVNWFSEDQDECDGSVSRPHLCVPPRLLGPMLRS